MENKIDWNKITGIRLWTLLFAFAALIMPGLTYIFLYRPELFDMEFSKLILIIFFYSFPLFMMNLVFFYGNDLDKKREKRDNEGLIEILYHASGLTIALFYITLLFEKFDIFSIFSMDGPFIVKIYLIPFLILLAFYCKKKYLLFIDYINKKRKDLLNYIKKLKK